MRLSTLLVVLVRLLPKMLACIYYIFICVCTSMIMVHGSWFIFVVLPKKNSYTIEYTNNIRIYQGLSSILQTPIPRSSNAKSMKSTVLFCASLSDFLAKIFRDYNSRINFGIFTDLYIYKYIYI